MADISITGDAYFSYASNKISGGTNKKGNEDNQRVRLKVVGSTGTTKVVAVIRNDGATRADKNGNKGIADAKSSLHMDSLYVTTKAGPVNIKAGDYWGTIGLGARSKGAAKSNALSLSTKVGPTTVGLFTANGSNGGSNSTHVNISGKVYGTTVKLVHNPDNFTDISVKGTFGGVLVAAEQWKDKDDSGTDNDTTLIHVGGKMGAIKWDVAQIKNDEAATSGQRNSMATGKLAPLGSMLIGTAARGGTATAIADVSHFTKIMGVAINTKFAGNTIKAIYTRNTLGANDKLTGTELILTRPLGGAMLTLNMGNISGSDDSDNNKVNKGLRLDVKF
ncbi:hypothetical protein CRYPD_556 [uncultured Candidatus Thioglobus sp.]|nr:hypothetical protein CRYPD_556 [uncultured Candidatus Thioglobus sp.]